MYESFQVNLFVRDIERSLAFYVALGAEESFRNVEVGVPDHVEVRIAGATIGLASEQSAREHHALEVSSSGNAAELVLWTTDLAESWEQLVAAGATPMALPEDLPNGLSVAWAADPDGNPVHLVMRRRD